MSLMISDHVIRVLNPHCDHIGRYKMVQWLDIGK